MLDGDEEKESEFVVEEEAEEGPALIKKLREKLKKAIEEKQEYLDGWQRSRADFANFKRQEAGIHADREEKIKADLIDALLPALDSLELSCKHSGSKEMELVAKQFLDALRRVGVEKFGEVGEIFDPYSFEALQEVATSKEEENNTIAEVRRAGYKVGDKIIRPAQVSVYAYKN